MITKKRRNRTDNLSYLAFLYKYGISSRILFYLAHILTIILILAKFLSPFFTVSYTKEEKMTQREFKKYVVCVPNMHVFGLDPEKEENTYLKDKEYLEPGKCPVCNNLRRVSLEASARMCHCIDNLCAQGCAYSRDIADIEDLPFVLFFFSSDRE